MTDPNNDGTTPPPPPPGGYGQPGGYSQPGGYGGADASAQQPGGYGQQPAAYSAPGAYAQPGYGAPAPVKTLSLIGMIAGIVGVVAFGYFLPASIAALVLGYLGRKREGAPAKGFWLTAIITGWVGVGFTIILGLILVLAVALPLFLVGSNGYTEF